MMLILIAIIVGVFYCLDAQHGERRDRSIVVWKSLPVSDVTAVLSKASIPLVVLPLLTFAIAVASHIWMMLLSSAVLVSNGLSPATPSQLPLGQSGLTLLYGLATMALWHAPIYAWLLLVSAWAKRAAILWAFLPPMALAVFEKMAFRTSYIGSFLRYRFVGWMGEAFAFTGQKGHVQIESLTQLTPARFLGSAGFWLGLIFAALFLAAAVRLRRDRAPL
jgi:ABC-2 type transport system permease protein